MMDSGAPFRQEPRHGRAGSGGLEQLDPAFPDRQHGHPYALLLHVLAAGHVQPEAVAVRSQGFVERRHGDSDVFDVHSRLP